MRIGPSIVSGGVAVLSLALTGCGLGSANLRQADGRLAPCDGGPHCVSSLESDADRKTEPLRYSGSKEAARKKLTAALATLPRSRIVADQPDYLHAEFTTALMRYVDDVEFVFRKNEPLIDVRSSSRIGYYDFGANRDRVEAIRVAFSKP